LSSLVALVEARSKRSLSIKVCTSSVDIRVPPAEVGF
jgi:hypothetical protein